MSVGAAVARRNAAIDTATGLGTWIKLHTGDPGSAGTANAASNTTRQQATMGSASAGAATNTAAVIWTSVPASETYSHWSMWTASSGGTFLWSGTITGGAVTSGETFRFDIGALSLTSTGAG